MLRLIAIEIKNDFFEVKLFRPEAESAVNNNQIINSTRTITDESG